MSKEKMSLRDKEKLLAEIRALKQRINELEGAEKKRKSAEQELQQYQRNFKEIVDLLPQTVYEMDSNGNFKFTNQRGFESFGYSKADIKRGIKFTQLFIPEERERLKQNIGALLNGKRSEGNEYTALRKDGSTFQALIYSSPIVSNDKVTGFRGVVIDITNRKKAEKELENSRDQLRNLSSHLQSVREEERSLIAREIHDELGQALTALKMDLIWINKRIPTESNEITDKIEGMSDLISSTMKTVRRLSSELRPGLLDDLGLYATLEWYCEEFEKRTGIDCNLKLNQTDLQLNEEIAISVFRIFQETLTNVARHAQATRVSAQLYIDDHLLNMKIEDNGIGISEEKINDHQSLGLIGLRERVVPWGGTLAIQGRRYKGTTVTVNIPLTKNNTQVS